MFSLQFPGRHRPTCLILLWANLAVLTTSPEITNSFRLELPIESEYTTDELFAALSPNYVEGSAVTIPDKFMGEERRGDKSLTHGLQTLESESISSPVLHGLPRPALDASIVPSRYPYPASHHVGRMSPPSKTRVLILPPDGSGVSRGNPRRRTVDKQVDTGKCNTGTKAKAKKLIRVANLLQKHPSHRSYFSASGTILIPFLKNARLEFQARLATIPQTFGSLNYHAITPLEKAVHPSLPYGCYRHDNGIGQLRVLKHNSNPQLDEVLGLHYRNLILFMHKLYEEALENLRIPLVDQVEHQQKMLNWLDGEIFDQARGYPILGIITAPFSIRDEDFQEKNIRPAQVHLLRFFSQDEDALGLLPDTATKLITEFRRESEWEADSNVVSETCC
ncbi:hypothetical protein PtB15_14B475 [Puccinia triticina]|nr:hypothetical protein PtB15_14B475 [Puccinia triticina]